MIVYLTFKLASFRLWSGDLHESCEWRWVFYNSLSPKSGIFVDLIQGSSQRDCRVPFHCFSPNVNLLRGSKDSIPSNRFIRGFERQAAIFLSLPRTERFSQYVRRPCSSTNL